MTDRIRIKSVFRAQQTAVFNYIDHGDGHPAAIVRDEIIAIATDDRHFAFSPFRPMSGGEQDAFNEWPYGAAIGFRYNDSDIPRLIENIDAAGSIDPDLWIEFQPDTRSLEEKWAEEAEIEQQERMGLR